MPTMSSLHSSFLILSILLLLTEVLGGDKAAFHVDYSSNWRDFVTNDATLVANASARLRHDVCGRYDDVRHGRLDLKWALTNLTLHPIFMIQQDYFHYSEEDGIPEVDPGLTVYIMDELARRGNFTWRSSFAVMPEPQNINISWTEALMWSVETFDLSVSWWFRSTERMEAGVAFLEPYSDSSLIMIGEPKPVLWISRGIVCHSH
jgi:hypothetical protein